MNVPKWISPVFWLAAAYDALLGVVFLVAPGWVFSTFEVTPPNHMGYVQFPAAMLIIFGLMFAAIARDPVGNRSLMVYGILLKIAYCSVTSFHWFTEGIPVIWKPFVVIDVIMGLLFVVSYSATSKKGS